MLTVSGPGRAGIILSIVMFPFITATGQSQSCQCQTQCLLPHQPWRERPEPERGQTAPAQSRSLISATTQCLLYLGKHCENITQGPQKCVIFKKTRKMQPCKSKYYFSKKIIPNLSFTLKFAWYLLKHGKLFFTHDDLAIHLFMKPSLDFLKIGVI